MLRLPRGEIPFNSIYFMKCQYLLYSLRKSFVKINTCYSVRKKDSSRKFVQMASKRLSHTWSSFRFVKKTKTVIHLLVAGKIYLHDADLFSVGCLLRVLPKHVNLSQVIFTCVRDWYMYQFFTPKKSRSNLSQV